MFIKPSLLRLSFLSVIFLSFAFVFSVYTSSQSTSEPEKNTEQVKTESSTNQPASAVDDTPHYLVGSYYTLENNIDAKLLLNNKGSLPLEVTPTLYNRRGDELQIQPVTVAPNSFRFINLQEWAASGGVGFQSGSIKLFHVGKDLVLGAQIYLTDEIHSVSFEEKLAELGKFDSHRLEAVWEMPTPTALAKIVLSNTTGAPLSLTAKLSKSPNWTGAAQNFQLAPHETKTLDLRQDFIDGGQFAGALSAGLSVSHAGAKEALLARVLVSDEAIGYSNVAQFSNPSGGKSSDYVGVGFRIEDVAGLPVTPVVLAKNVGNVRAKIVTRVPYTKTDGTRGTINLPTKNLAAGEIGLIDTRNIINRAAREEIEAASLEVEYDTVPGSVIIAAHSVSGDGNHVFRVPMWDPLGQRSPTGGYPWRIEGTSATETYIKNNTNQEQDYVAFLLWEGGGMYMFGLKPIAGHETVHIDVKKLRDEQIPDEQGRTIPQSVSSGQLQWTLRRKDSLPEDDVRANLALIGRSEQVDIPKGTVNNYSCQNCCGGSFMDGYIEAFYPWDTGELEAGDERWYVAYQVDSTCYGTEYPYIVQGVTWSSNNTSVATINSGGVVTGVGGGNATIRAFWRPRFYTATQPCGPPQYIVNGNPEADDCVRAEEITLGKKRKVDNPSDETPNIAPCGSCTSRTLNYDDYEGVVVVPKVTMNVPQTAQDGSTATFSVTTQGGTPTGYQWSFSAPPGAGNNPQVNFTSANSATTNAPAHWFANPNSDCATTPPALNANHPYYNSTYKIKVKVTFQDGTEINKEKDFTVNAYWAPAGSVAPATISGGPQTGYDSVRNLYVVINSGTMARNTNSAVINVPTTSQFYNKTLRHEEKHELQWQSGLFRDIRTVNGFMAVISNFTDTTAAGLSQQINQAYLTWDAQQEQDYLNNFSAAELEAYAISDLLAPQYAYQRCGRTTFP